MNNQYLNAIVVTGKIGIVDAKLLRYLEKIKSKTEKLLVYVTQSLYSNLITKEHIEEFISALSFVSKIIGDKSELEYLVQQTKTEIIKLPEEELQNYSISRILKKVNTESKGNSQDRKKVVRTKELVKRYGNKPFERNFKLGLVSGSFDLIHS